MVHSPLRLPLGGGGTDLPSAYVHAGGEWLAAALDLVIEVEVGRPGEVGPEGRLRPRHRLLRAALERRDPALSELSVTVRSPVPAGSGLGSSGSLATALVVALDRIDGTERSLEALAEESHRVEVVGVGPTAGKQDPWIAAVGGVTWFSVDRAGRVEHGPASISASTLEGFRRRLALFSVGGARRSSDVLATQDRASREGDLVVGCNLDRVRAIGRDIRRCLESGDLDPIGPLFHEHWALKRTRTPGATSAEIDAMYELARRHGAEGGKVVGAGGGGYLLLCGPNLDEARRSLAVAGHRELRFGWRRRGAEVVAP